MYLPLRTKMITKVKVTAAVQIILDHPAMRVQEKRIMRKKLEQEQLQMAQRTVQRLMGTKGKKIDRSSFAVKNARPYSRAMVMNLLHPQGSQRECYK